MEWIAILLTIFFGSTALLVALVAISPSTAGKNFREWVQKLHLWHFVLVFILVVAFGVGLWASRNIPGSSIAPGPPVVSTPTVEPTLPTSSQEPITSPASSSVSPSSTSPPAKGTLRIVSQPSGASIFVNGTDYQAKTPFELPADPGEHLVRLVLDGYQMEERRLKVQSGQLTEIDVTLSPSEIDTQIYPSESIISPIVTMESTPIIQNTLEFNESIVFLNGNDLYTVNMDGSDCKRIFQGITGSISVSSTTNEIAIVSHGDIYLINALNGEAINITNINLENGNDWKSREASDPFFSPDGEKIGFLQTGKMRILNRDGSKYLDFFNMGVSVALQPQWSPSGDLVAFNDDFGSLWIIDLNSMKSRLLLEEQTRRSIYYWDFSWSPDGKQIATISSDNRIYIIDIQTGSVHPLVEATYPSWSPDGKSLACVLPNKNLGIFDILQNTVLEIENTEPWGIENPIWLPDGKRIVFGSGSNLYVTSIDTKQVNALTNFSSGTCWFQSWMSKN